MHKNIENQISEEDLKNLKNTFFEKPSDYIGFLITPELATYFKKVESIFFDKTDKFKAQVDKIKEQCKPYGKNVPADLLGRYTYYWDLYNTNTAMIVALIHVLRGILFHLEMCISVVDSLHTERKMNERLIKEMIQKNNKIMQLRNENIQLKNQLKTNEQ